MFKGLTFNFASCSKIILIFLQMIGLFGTEISSILQQDVIFGTLVPFDSWFVQCIYNSVLNWIHLYIPVN